MLYSPLIQTFGPRAGLPPSVTQCVLHSLRYVPHTACNQLALHSKHKELKGFRIKRQSGKRQKRVNFTNWVPDLGLIAGATSRARITRVPLRNGVVSVAVLRVSSRVSVAGRVTTSRCAFVLSPPGGPLSTAHTLPHGNYRQINRVCLSPSS